MSSVHECRRLEFPSFEGQRGTLTVAEAESHVPFPIARVFWLHHVPSGQRRGAHAHKRCRQVLVCMSGRVAVHLDDGIAQRTVQLERPDQGLYIEPMIWVEINDFTEGAVAMVLASDPYDEADYLRDHGEFRTAVAESE